MNSQNIWQCLSVQEFFQRMNWRGNSLEITLDHDLSSSPSLEVPSLSLSVSEFFQRSNWQGKDLELVSHSNLTSALDLTLPVNKFFQFIDWQGKPEIAALQLREEVLKTNSPEETLTDLSDLSDLF